MEIAGASIEIPEGLPYMVIEREIGASRDEVWHAHDDHGLLTRWMGPFDTEITIDRWDFWTGGSFRFRIEQRNQVFGFWGVFHDVRPDRIVFTRERSNAPDEVELRTIHLIRLPGERTRIRVENAYRTVEARDAEAEFGMPRGLAESYARLDALLVEGRPAGARA